MVMKKGIAGKIIIVAIVLVMLLPILIEKATSGILKQIDFSGYEKTITDTKSYIFALV